MAKRRSMNWTAIIIIIAVLSLPFLLLQQQPESEAGARGPHVALIELSGVIADTGGTIRPKPTVEMLRKAQTDPKARAVIIRINSGGGSPAASQEIYNEIRRTSAQGKPVVISIGDVAASGGYYIAAAGDVIVASPSSTTGSIGVIAQFQVIEDLLEQYGIVSYTLTTGEHKAMGNALSHPDEATLALYRALLDDVLDQFIHDVAAGRNMDPERVRAIADGRVVTGRQAVEYGLIDRLGGLEEAIMIAGELAGIEGRPTIVPIRSRERTWQDWLLDIGVPDWSPAAILDLFGIVPGGVTLR